MRTLDDFRERLLVLAIQSGKPGAFDRLLDKYEPRIFNLALRMLGDNRQEAEDATQETLVSVYRGLAGFGGRSSLDTWIHRIAVNECLQRRRKRTEAHEPLEDAVLEHTPAADPSGDPLAASLKSELSVALGDAVAKLQEPQQTVVLLHGMQGFTYAEVATILDCPVGTVKSRLSAAFVQIRSALSGYMSVAEPQAETASRTTSPSTPIPEAGR